MNFFQKIGVFITGLFTHAGPAVQSTVDEAGKLVDTAEGLFNQFAALSVGLPTQYAALVAAFGLAIHNIDSYLDTIETQPSAPAPAPTTK